MTEIVSQHIEKCGALYILPKEKRLLRIVAVYMSILSFVLLILKGYLALSIFCCFAIIPIIYVVYPARMRSKFIQSGNSYLIFKDYLEPKLGGEGQRFYYKDKRIESIQRSDGCMDIVIGESAVDILKHYASGKKRKIVICGLINGSDVFNIIRMK